MAEWLFDRNGRPRIILDAEKIRSRQGKVIAWISRNSVYSLQGRHRGWFGALYSTRAIVRSPFRAIGPLVCLQCLA